MAILTDTDNQEFEHLYSDAHAMIDKAIEGYMVHDPAVPEILTRAMLYSLRAGGKRLRPVMVLLSCKVCGGQDVVALPAAVAIEMVHTYSLIHDDLPAMDNDDLRRGQPTNHKVFGDAIAILAGDALLTYAFHTLAMHIQKDYLVRKLVIELSEASGANGMIGGQVADITSQNLSGDLETVQYIHTYKTAMMFRAAARMGAICADTDDHTIDLLSDYGLKLGLAFQIIDDLLDLDSTTQELGKRTQKDSEAGKLTYPQVLGVEESRNRAKVLLTEAKQSLAELGSAANPLMHLATMLVDRNK